MDKEKKGIPLVCEAVTFAAQLLSSIKRDTNLDSHDRAMCELAQRKLERAEKVLYGWE